MARRVAGRPFQWAALQQGSLTRKRFCVQYVQLPGEFDTVHPPALPESAGPVSSAAGAGWGKGPSPTTLRPQAGTAGPGGQRRPSQHAPARSWGPPRARVHPMSWPDILKPLRRAPLTVARTLLLSLSYGSMQWVLRGEKPPTPLPGSWGWGGGGTGAPRYPRELPSRAGS